MGTISSAFSLMSQALDADQAALNVVANNVANANTPGYTEETPTWQRNQPIRSTDCRLAQGHRNRRHLPARQVLVERLDQQQQLASASSSRLSALNTVQALFTPASGSSSFDGRGYRERHYQLFQLLFLP